MTLSHDNKVLNLVSRSEEICFKDIPEPQPPAPGSQRCNFYQTIDGHLVSVNIATNNGNHVSNVSVEIPINNSLNSNSNDFSNGVKVSVKAENGEIYPNAVLYYQPCLGLKCPQDSYCEGNEDATIWLCYDNNAGLSTRTCKSFGEYTDESKIDLTLAEYNNTKSGIKVRYYQEKREGDVYWKCDSSIQHNDLEMPQSVIVKDEGNTIEFNVSAYDVCRIEPPIWTPTIPDISEIFEPTPVPSPNPIQFVANSTHYVYLDLSELSQPVYNGSIRLAYPGSTEKNLSQLEVFYHPWDQIEFDQRTILSEEIFGWGNIYGCWPTTNDTVCYALATKYLPIYLTTNDPNNEVKELENLILHYQDGYKIHTDINISCNPNAEKDQIIFDSDAIAKWYGDTVSFVLDSAYVCPLEFKKNYNVVTKNPNVESSKSKVTTKFETPLYSISYINFDISGLKQINQDVYVGSRESLYKMKLFYHPSQLINCPSNYKFLNSQSNLWLCGDFENNQNSCFSAANVYYKDIEFQLNANCSYNNRTYDNISYIIDDDLEDGVSLIYQSENYLTRVSYLCNESLENQVDLFPVIQLNERQGMPYLQIYVQTGGVCRMELERLRTTMGAIILTYIILATSLYFGGKFIYNWKFENNPRIPHADLLELIILPFSCLNEKVSQRSQHYDHIEIDI